MGGKRESGELGGAAAPNGTHVPSETAQIWCLRGTGRWGPLENDIITHTTGNGDPHTQAN